jgi:FKBP-type peptidyl-prolyl cis-trans isomerase FklB
MKKLLLPLALAFVTTGLFAQKDKMKNDAKPAKLELKNALDSANYAYGMVIAGNVKRQMGTELNLQIFLAALNATLQGDSTKMSADAANTTFSTYNKAAQTRAAARWKDDNAKFLEENKKRKEVTTTASGLQYEVMKRGTGTLSPKETDRVDVHYHGTTIDGTVFDSSVERGKTSQFGLNQVIKGWTEGLQYMKEGDKFKFYIPYNLAYGEQQRGPKIKGFSTLIFEVELFKVNP